MAQLWTSRARSIGKGQTGSAVRGSLRISCFLTEILVGTPVKCALPKMPGRTFFPNPAKYVTIAAALLVLTPFVRSEARPRGLCGPRFPASDPGHFRSGLQVDLSAKCPWSFPLGGGPSGAPLGIFKTPLLGGTRGDKSSRAPRPKVTSVLTANFQTKNL